MFNNQRRSITRRFHCDAASLFCRCAAHSEDAGVMQTLRAGINVKAASDQMQKTNGKHKVHDR